MEERRHGVELFPCVRHFEFIAVLVGELFVFIRIVQPILEIKHHIGVTVGLVAVQAALVIVGNGVKIILLVAFGLVLFGELI